MATQATHHDNIAISITQAPLPVTDAKFITVLYMREDISLNGSEVVTYTDIVGAQADLDAGYIDAGTLAAVTAAFTAPKKPQQFKVGKVDVIGGDSYDDALTKILAVDCDFWAIVTELRVDATAVTFQLTLEARANNSDGFRGYLVHQSADADWKTTGLPAAFSTVSSSKRLAVVYHDAASEIDDVRWAVARSVWDPNQRSAPWDGEIVGGANLTSDPTSAEKGFLDANFANHALPYGTVDRWMDAGTSIDGAKVHEALTTDWVHVNLLQDIVARKVAFSARGRKWPMDAEGVAIYRGVLESRFSKGVAAQHFKAGQTTVTVHEITIADLALEEIRASAEATYLNSARLFQVDAVFGRADVNVVE